MEEAVRRLAQYRPFAHAGLDARVALGDLVVAAIMEGGGQIESLASCRETCRVLWGLDVELDEVRSAVELLQSDGRLEKTGPAYALTPAAQAELELTLTESAALESRALNDWTRALLVIWPLLKEEELQSLRADLELWLRQVIARHGVEAALLLYPEEPRAREMFAALEKMGLDFLPKRSKEIDAIREQALSMFVRQPSDNQRVLLATLLNTSYVMAVLSLDPAASELVRDVSRGQRVYLDTNIVYRLLNLQTPRQFLSTRRLLDLTRELGYEIAVTPWTIAELRTSLERARSYLKSKAIPPGELANLAAAATTDENFVTAYWRRLRDKPVSVDDFFDFYNEIEAHLEELGVSVISDGCVAVDRDEAGINDELSIIDALPGPRLKPEPVKLHDVKHRLLIERLRGDSPRRFSNAGFWFLTADSSLPRYDYAARHGESGLAFCITAGAWLQVTRAFVPRTEDYDQTLLDLMSSPYMRYRGRIGYDAVQEVIGRIDLFTGATPGLAAKLLVNTALLREVAETATEDGRRDLIDNAIVQAAQDLEGELEEALQRGDEEKASRIAALEHVGDLARALESERADVNRLTKELDEERSARREASDRAEADAIEDQTRQEHRLRQLSEQLSAQRKSLATLKRVLRFATAVLIAAGAVAVVVALLMLDVVEGRLTISLVIVAGICACATAVAVGVNRRLAWAALGGTGGLVTMAAAIYDFLK